MSLGSLLDDQHWHHITVEHHGTHLNLTVDKNTLWVQIPPTFEHWDHDKVCFCWLTWGKQKQKDIQMLSASILKWLCVLLMFFFSLYSDECGNRPGPRFSEVSRVTQKFSRLFGKPCLQQRESRRPRQTEEPAGHCEGKSVENLCVGLTTVVIHPLDYSQSAIRTCMLRFLYEWFRTYCITAHLSSINFNFRIKSKITIIKIHNGQSCSFCVRTSKGHLNVDLVRENIFSFMSPSVWMKTLLCWCISVSVLVSFSTTESVFHSWACITLYLFNYPTKSF